MTVESDVGQRISKIRSVFMESTVLAEKNLNIDYLLEEVNRSGKETRPIVVESLAFILAEKDLQEKDIDLTSWRSFKQQVDARYETAVLVGLGWALAKHEISHEAVNLEEGGENLAKIYDGVGYYFGFFRHRQTVKNQLFPVFIPAAYRSFFFQGIGRTLWYVSGGNLASLLSLTAFFKEENLPGLWRGIGIACIFVGGSTPSQLDELTKSTMNYQQDFLNGMKQARQVLMTYDLI